ncbi:unnamed protein product [Linum trigynum]|uniref:Uncharacterized protein n=1 Tax=Linum trigynum TaxID=586398 RepID=A0AAV2FZR4_9ROSI
MAPAAVEIKSAHPRPTSNFHPSVWGDFFLTLVPHSDEVVKSWNEEIEVLKSHVKKALLSSPVAKTAERLHLIDAIERLGTGYHFEEEIEQVLGQIYQDLQIRDDEDLVTVALRFRLLRQHGYNVSSDVFDKFKRGGEFKKELVNDGEGMLNLYEAAYLRTRGESILDEAIEFTKTHLISAMVSAAAELGSPVFAELVARALKRPLRKVVESCEHLSFISVYEKFEGHDPKLVKLAKLNFNVLQNMYQTELRILTEWWMDLDTPNKLSYARDKLVESYFWAIGPMWEPKYSLARQFFTKTTQIGTLLDDTYDVHGTIDDLELFTNAIVRWDTSKKDKKDYMIILLEAISAFYDEIEAVTCKEGRVWCLDDGKRAVANVARLYLAEERWVDKGCVPTLEEYREVSSLSTCYEWMVYSALCAMGASVSQHVFQWLFSKPTMLIATTDLCRLMDDVADSKVKQGRENFATSVECYMKQYDVSRQEAVEGLNRIIEEDWMIMHEELLNPPSGVPRELLVMLFRLAQVMDTIYKDFDGYTYSSTATNDMLVALLVTPLVV